MAPRKKQPRRKPGTGSIRHKKGRTLPWETAFPLGRQQWRYDYHATRPEAEAYLDRLAAERDNADTPRNIVGGSQRVDAFLVAWLTMKRAHVKPKTFASYRYLCNLAVAEIGMLRLDQVTRERADDLIAYFHSRDFKAIALLRAVLRQAFEYALEGDYIKKNPFQRVKTPSVEHRQARSLTEAQRAHMLVCAQETDRADVPLYPLWHLYSRLGLRRGEGIGLRRADIDFQAGTLTVTQQYTHLNGKTILSTPKTKKSRRVLPVPPDILDMLRWLIDWQVKQVANNPDRPLSPLIFTDPHGDHLTVGHVDHRWKLLRTAAGLPDDIHIHDLRHTALTIVELSGAPLSVVQAIAGHTTITMAMHYTDHAALDDMRRALGA